MYHYFNAITNTKGDSLVGYRVGARNSATGAVIPLFADGAGTPIVALSGLADLAITDAAGNASFYVTPGNYSQVIFDPTGNLVQTVPDVPMGINTVSDINAAPISNPSMSQTVAAWVDKIPPQTVIRAYAQPTGSDITGEVNAAVAALDSTNGGTIAVPVGQWTKLGPTTVDRPVSFRGINSQAQIVNQAGSNNAFTITTANGNVSFKDMTFNNTLNNGTGWSIGTNIGGSGILYRLLLDGVVFVNGGSYVDTTNCADFKMISCDFVNYQASAVKVANPHNEDAGDSSIIGCSFIGAAGGTGIDQRSSGGLRVIGSKFNNGACAYDLNLQLATAVTTSILLFEGNSVENMSVAGARMRRTAGAGGFSYVKFLGNEWGYNPTTLQTDNTNAFDAWSFKDNDVIMPANAYGLDIQGTVRGTSDDNYFQAPSNSLAHRVGANADHFMIGGGNRYGPGVTPYTNASSSTIITTHSITGTATATANTASGALFYGDLAITFPDGAFTFAPQVTCSFVGGGVSAGVSVTPTTSGFTARVWALSAGTAVTFTYHANGV